MNPLIDNTLQGTVQNVASALGALTALLGQGAVENPLYWLLLPMLDALEQAPGA